MPPTILDPQDTVILDAIEVLAYPTPGSKTPTPVDSCAVRIFVASLHRTGADQYQILVREDFGEEKPAEERFGEPLGSFPGPKEGSAAFACIKPGELIVYYSGRLIDAAGAPFPAQVEVISVPDIWPLGRSALWRVRNLARIMSKYLPAAAEELKPYTK
jgi:hypothetical protein